ncbi:FAD-binding molybdopterin dehydrogenase [Caballeronia catudaia]|uniref:FAD-binding molybdopterin dehydrogenase n=2 Tax=Caballeronia catudaia TaxID=1777136 RepID=A0A158ANN1_9BURK|nr:FAD-binding molybdopterin dehydrogenase [Caballeronia catudaia]
MSTLTMTKQTIRFLQRGAVREIGDAPPARTVLQHLRETALCTGTKEGCAEGDCGACTVVIGELDTRGRLALKAVNACIQFLPTLDSRALFTVEDLRGDDGALHPVQQALVDCHGSQCGFCTPGFVMSLWALYHNHPRDAAPPSRDEIATALSGNLCRCTGYRPIVDAAQRMFDYPRPPFDADAITRQLAALKRTRTFEYQSFHAPVTRAEFARLRAAHPNARLLAGSTDVGLWVTKQFRDLGDMLFIGNVDELKTIERDANTLTIGAAASLEDAYAALAVDYPELTELWTRFASRPIRNAGTLGGNVANGSPIGDSMPALIALNASLVLQKAENTRVMPLDAFYLGYQKTALDAGEFVAAIRVPRPVAALRFRTYKVSKRYDQDISAVCAAFAIRLDDDNRVTDARIAFGGMAATPKRATRAEAALVGRSWDEAAAHAAMAALDADFQPLTDMRASSAYRTKVARNVLRRFYLETRRDAPLALAEVNAFAFDAKESP